MDFSEHIGEDAVVLHHLTVVTYLTPDGTPCMGTFTSDGLPCWEAFGMATLATEQFRNHMIDTLDD